MNKAFSFLISGIFIVTALGCQPNRKEKINSLTREKSINRLEQKIEKLEQIIKQDSVTPSKKNMHTPTGRIKSLTFRIGTEDDRLRIYWEDGSKSDLPCTKEQFIWACG